jgi:hypothetical protein
VRDDEIWFVELYERRHPAVLAYGVRRVGPEGPGNVVH